MNSPILYGTSSLYSFALNIYLTTTFAERGFTHANDGEHIPDIAAKTTAITTATVRLALLSNGRRATATVCRRYKRIFRLNAARRMRHCQHCPIIIIITGVQVVGNHHHYVGSAAPPTRTSQRGRHRHITVGVVLLIVGMYRRRTQHRLTDHTRGHQRASGTIRIPCAGEGVRVARRN